MNIQRYILLLMTLWAQVATAQVDSLNQQLMTGKDPRGTASPSVEGARKSKALSLQYNMVGPFVIDSRSLIGGVEDQKARVRRLNEFKLKFKVPIILKPYLKLIAGVRYTFEEYNFQDPEALSSDIYNNLEDKNLHALGLNFNVISSLNDRNYLLLRAGMALNGDYSGGDFPLRRYIKYQASALYGWKYDYRHTFGVGISFNYTLGRPSIYPVILWNRSFNDKWGIESVFPARVFIRNTISEKTILLAGYEVQGNSYHITIDNPPLSQFPALELRRSDLLPKLILERELYDFLWIAMEGGYRVNLNFDVDKDDSFNREPVLENDLQGSFYVNFSLFVVPPKKLSTKYLKGTLQ